jgi:hypothetical protein
LELFVVAIVKKGDKTDRGNYRDMLLSLSTYKIFGYSSLNLPQCVEEITGEHWSSSLVNKSNIYRIFIIVQVGLLGEETETK